MSPAKVEYALQHPPFFRDEESRWSSYESILNVAHELIETRQTKTQLESIRFSFLTRLSLIPYYSLDDSLKPLMELRGNLLHLMFRNTRFPNPIANGANRLKRKLLVFKPSLNAGPELASTVAHICPVNGEFEVLLACQHPPSPEIVERLNHEGVTVGLVPESLMDAANAIFQYGADVIFYATNQSAVTNTATLLGNLRLAPIQIASTMSPVTTGLKSIDFFLTGVDNEFPGFSARYTELPLMVENDINEYADFCLAPSNINHLARCTSSGDGKRYIVAGNMNKIVREAVEAWIDVISNNDTDELKIAPYNPNWQASYATVDFESWVHDIAESRGVDRRRVQFVGPFPDRHELLALIKASDVYLDTFPYSGAVSVLDPIACNTPFITLEGRQARFRQASIQARRVPSLGTVTDCVLKYTDIARSVAIRRNLNDECVETNSLHAEPLASRFYRALLEYI